MLAVGDEPRAAVLQACVDRIPGSTAFPSGAIDACLDVAQVKAREVAEVVVAGRLRAPGMRVLAGLAPARDRLAAFFPRRVAEARLASVGLHARVELVDRAAAEAAGRWFAGIASPAVAGAAALAGVRPGEAPGAWGPAFGELALYRALRNARLPCRKEELRGGRLGVFDGALPFGPDAGLRTVVGVGPLGDPLPLSPADAIDAWRRGACDRLRLGPFWIGPEDR